MDTCESYKKKLGLEKFRNLEKNLKNILKLGKYFEIWKKLDVWKKKSEIWK